MQIYSKSCIDIIIILNVSVHMRIKTIFYYNNEKR